MDITSQRLFVNVGAYAVNNKISLKQSHEEIQEWLFDKDFKWDYYEGVSFKDTTILVLNIDRPLQLCWESFENISKLQHYYTGIQELLLKRTCTVTLSPEHNLGENMTFTVNEKTMLEPKVGEKYKCVAEGWACDVGETMAIEYVDCTCANYITEKGLKGFWGFTTYPNDFQLVSTKAEQPKPPLGLRSWHIADAERVVEILDAMKRYTAEHKPIPEEWMEELIEKTVIDYEQ